MKEIKIQISDDTYNKLQSLSKIINYMTREKPRYLFPEDLVKNAIFEYLEKYFDQIDDHERKLIANLGSHHPLKNTIENYLRKHPLSLTEISHQLRIDKSTLSNIVNNKNQPSLDIFLRIWIFLGCPPLHEILYREVQE